MSDLLYETKFHIGLVLIGEGLVSGILVRHCKIGVDIGLSKTIRPWSKVQMANEDKPENKTSIDKFGWSKVQKNEIKVQDDMNLEDTRASERGNELEQEERLEPEDEL
ncbi:hypothetical protein YC2023_065363 [Brassica napus]